MKVDRLGGDLSFANGTIARGVSRTRFLQTSLGHAAKEAMSSGEWRHYHIEPEDGIAGTAVFEGNNLDRIFLTLRIPSDNAAEWSVERELERKAIHDRLLREELGAPPYVYPWGKVFSDFDAKSVASEIIVVYER